MAGASYSHIMHAIDQIPVRHIALMNEMGSERLKEMLGETGPSTS